MFQGALAEHAAASFFFRRRAAAGPADRDRLKVKEAMRAACS
jgi:hypothetical protein